MSADNDNAPHEPGKKKLLVYEGMKAGLEADEANEAADASQQ